MSARRQHEEEEHQFEDAAEGEDDDASQDDEWAALDPHDTAWKEYAEASNAGWQNVFREAKPEDQEEIRRFLLALGQKQDKVASTFAEYVMHKDFTHKKEMEEKDTTHKTELDEKDAIIADYKKKLEEKREEYRQQ